MFPKIRRTLFCGPYNKDPTVCIRFPVLYSSPCYEPLMTQQRAIRGIYQLWFFRLPFHTLPCGILYKGSLLFLDKPPGQRLGFVA